MAWIASVRNLSFWSPILSTIRGSVCLASRMMNFGSWRDSLVRRWLRAAKPAVTIAECWELDARRRASKSSGMQLSGTLCCLIADFVALTWWTFASTETSLRRSTSRLATCSSDSFSAMMLRVGVRVAFELWLRTKWVCRDVSYV